MILYKLTIKKINAIGQEMITNHIIPQKELIKELKNNIGREMTIKPIGLTNKVANYIRTDK